MADSPSGAAAAAALSRAPGKAPFAKVLVDEFARAYDLHFRGSTGRACALDGTALEALDAAPWQLLLVVGPTASGKSLALAQLRDKYGLLPDRSAELQFARDKAVVSHPQFGGHNTAVDRLGLVGACARCIARLLGACCIAAPWSVARCRPPSCGVENAAVTPPRD